MTKLDLYQQNQNLSQRLLESLILYLQDQYDGTLSKPQKAESKQAAFTLCDTAIQYMDDSLSEEIQNILLRIFSRIVHDLARDDINSLMRDVKALQDIRKMC